MNDAAVPKTFAPTGLQWLYVLGCGFVTAALHVVVGAPLTAGNIASDVLVVVAVATLVGWIFWFLWRLITRGQWRQNAARLGFMLSATCLMLIALRDLV